MDESFAGDAGTLKETVACALAGFKVPQRIWLQTEPLPRNAAGKTIKRQLVQQAVALTQRDASSGLA